MDVGLVKHRPRKNHDKEIAIGFESEGGKMITNRSWRRCSPVSLVVLIAVCVLLIGVAGAQAAGGASPVASPTSNAVSASVRAVQPAVSGLFQVHAPRAWVDALDNAGKPGKNGVPDFLDSWEAFGARTSSAILDKAYAFTTIDKLSHEILYAGVERASTGASSVVLEFNQKLGERLLGDLKITAEIDAAGSVGTVSFERYAGEAKGSSKFLSLAILAGEGCNDAGTACVVANGALLEFGYNVTAFGKPDKAFTGIQITTPEDSASGTLVPMQAADDKCMQTNAGFALNCNAKDVKVGEVKDVSLVNGDGCDDAQDTAHINASVKVVLTSQARYDIGVYLGTDGTQALTGSSCVDFILPITSPGVNLDGTTNPQDTCGDIDSTHSPLTVTGVLQNVEVPCSNSTNNTVNMPYCVSWRQPGSNEFCDSIDDAFPGSPSKCQCGLAPVTCLCVPTNECYTAACDGTGTCVQTPKAAGSACGDPSSGVCDAPDTCNGSGVCQPNHGSTSTECRAAATGGCDVAELCAADGTCPADVKAAAGAACGDSSDSICDNPDTCDANGVCQSNHEAITTVCRAADGSGCDVAELCAADGTCPADAKAAAGAACGDSSDSICDNPDTCNASGVCQSNHEPITTVCRAAVDVCDAAENCAADGSCPADAKAASGTPCGSSGNTFCDDPDTCDGNGTCLENHANEGVICRGDNTNPCDPAEVCTNGVCPGDICRDGDPKFSSP
jgi:hypothetical protein